MLDSRKFFSLACIVLPNAILFYASLWLTIVSWYPEGLGHDQLTSHVAHFSAVYALWLLAFFSFHMFERETYQRYTTLFFSLVSAMAVNLLIAIGYFYFQPELIITPRRFLLVNVLTAFVLILLYDLLLKCWVFSRFVQPVYLFVSSSELDSLANEISKHSYLGFQVAGKISEAGLANLSSGSGGLVIFPDNLHANQALAGTIFSLRNRGIWFYNHNTFYEKILRRIYLPLLNEIWFLQNITYSRKVFYELMKYVIDIVCGVIALLVFIVTFPVVALVIKLSSPGPILFTQNRVGKNGRQFTIYKYRTMVAGEHANQWTKHGDNRITRVGRFLRLTRLDELPQSINLLKGDMSVVGPRPEQVGIVENLKSQIPFYDERHMVKPGLTGWAQLNIYAGSLEETKLKLEYDLYYLKHRSLLFDMEIIMKTIYNILRMNGR
jgi:exopolysaccharide biosynthesis polyprenyl glycosylphosphotransferase